MTAALTHSGYAETFQFSGGALNSTQSVSFQPAIELSECQWCRLNFC